MERAGAKDMGDDVERKGLGTPVTRVNIIEKLVKDGFVKREKKQIIPTEDGIKLITVLLDVVKSPKLTTNWENALTLVARGEFPMEDFMADIEYMVSELIHTYHEVSDKQKKMFVQEQETLGGMLELRQSGGKRKIRCVLREEIWYEHEPGNKSCPYRCTGKRYACQKENPVKRVKEQGEQAL